MLQLFPDEELLVNSSNGEVTLTTHRIAYEYRDFGRSYNQSIMLEHITSCENVVHSKVGFLIGGAIGAVWTIYSLGQGTSEAISIGLIVTIACGILYLLSKSNVIIISSPSTRMIIKINGMSRERVMEFINKVEQAKYKRISLVKIR